MEQHQKKSKKTALYSGITAAVLIAVVIWIATRGPSGETADDVAELHAALAEEGETGLELIDKALADKKIKEEMALVYKIYAVYGDEKLPEEYKGNFFYEGTQAVREMMEKWDSLSDETKALLEPYTKRPEEEGSWMNLRYGGATDNAETGWLVPNAYAIRASAYTEFFTSADGKVKIWYPSVSGTVNNIYNPGTTAITADTGKKMAKKIQGFLDDDKIIASFEQLLQKQLMSDGTKGGDGKLDIYVAPCGNDLGLTFAEGGTPTASHIIMNYKIGLNRDNVLKTTLAHEIFHSFQYTYKYNTTRDNWWSEATAVWSEDFIYPEVNSEHGWLKRFIPYPTTQADKETPPAEHHYAAYILAYFITNNFDDDFMRKSWEACESGACVDGIDKNIDGGFKDQWKKFTLWNYNREPAQYYIDWGPFPTDSSASSQEAESVMITIDGEHEIEAQELKPLSADLSDAVIALDETSKAKKIIFKDLKNFTGKTDKAGLKAVIYYKNGKKEVEDWTDKNQRSFCIENKDEDLDHVVLIFSNADMKKNIEASKVKAVTKNSCFEINQEDDRTAVIHFPVQGGTVNINTTIDAVTDGETEKDASEEVDYGYQTQWSVWYEFEQVRDAFSIPCESTTADFEAGWTTRAAGYLKFNLDPESDGYDKKNNTFSIDMHYGEPHPNGNYEDVPGLGVNCAGMYFGPSKVDLSDYKGVFDGIYTGKITNMTSEGATIEIPNCCLYHDCNMQTGAKFQTISKPILLEIKKPAGK